MSLTGSYLGVVLIWSTTPLAIQWSGDGPGFLFAVAARMVLGLAVLLAVISSIRLPFPWHPEARLAYAVSGISLFVAMTLVYWSAQRIPSGWIAVVFGLSPILTGLFSGPVLGERALHQGRWLGLTLGLCGLAIIFLEGATLEQVSWVGVLGVFLSAVVHSFGTVLIKRLRPTMPALSLTTGGLVVATPLFVTAMLLGSGWPQSISPRALAAIGYLGVLGSAVGFPLYFYVLKHLSAVRVALITLITPVSALLLGAGLNGEAVSLPTWLGTALILAGLAVYEVAAGRTPGRQRA